MKHFLSLHGSDKGLAFLEEDVFCATCTPEHPTTPTEVAYEVQEVRASAHAAFYRGQHFQIITGDMVAEDTMLWGL